MTLKELRKQKNISQKQCASYLGVPLRTYQMYETDDSRFSTIKYDYMMQKLAKYDYIDETHGLLSIQQIKKHVKKYLRNMMSIIVICLGLMQKEKQLKAVMLIF